LANRLVMQHQSTSTVGWESGNGKQLPGEHVMRANFLDGFGCCPRGLSASLSDVLVQYPLFSPPCLLVLLLLSRIKKYNVCCLPAHTPTKLCLTHLLPPTAPRRSALANTNQVPYHSCGTLTGVTAITRNCSPPSPLFVILEREVQPPHGDLHTNELAKTNQLN
jgi:hypothetical protein